MKIKVGRIVTAVGILKTVDTTKLKLSTAYQVKQVLNKCEEAITDFESRRIELAKEYGTLNEDEQFYNFETDEAKQNFQDGLQELLEDEIDLDIKKIPIELLDDYITIEPSNIDFISWFISGLE